MNITDFITIGSGGVSIATFAEIRDGLIEAYKGAYGEDIDISSGSADDVFINNTALIINNILRSVSQMYANLDVATASGKYLESLCRLANIVRKPAIASTAIITIANATGTVYDVPIGYQVTDPNGNTWSYRGSAFTIPNGESRDITVVCDVFGPIVASAGTLFPILVESNVTVTQANDALVGSNKETDAELRSRRTSSAGASGTTTLESLYGGLLTLAGIKDVYIYNNNTGNDTVALADGRFVTKHCVYIVIARQNPNTSSPFTPDEIDTQIANTIYDRLTPGICTDPSTGAGKVTNNGTPITIDMRTLKDDLLSVTALTAVDFDVRWKQATPVHPAIEITITPLATFNESEISDQYKQEFLTYLNSLPIGTNLSRQNILIKALDLDPFFNGRATYNVALSNVLIDIDGDNNFDASDYTNPLTYYNYTTLTYNTGSHKITIS